MIKIEYFGEKEERHVGPIDIFVKLTYVNGALKNERLKHIVRHSPDGFNFSYAGSGPADLALSILTDFCNRKKISNSIVEELYQRFKFDFIANSGNKLSINCIDIVNWLATNKPELKGLLFKEE